MVQLPRQCSAAARRALRLAAAATRAGRWQAHRRAGRVGDQVQAVQAGPLEAHTVAHLQQAALQGQRSRSMKFHGV